MKSNRVVFAGCVALAGIAISPMTASAYSPLSIDSASLPPGVRVLAVEILPTTRQIMAVCHAPSGWSISVSNSIGSLSALDLKAPSDAVPLSSDRFDQFQHIAMLNQDVKDNVTGTLTVQDGDGTGPVRQIALSIANFRQSEAARCPPASEWQTEGQIK